MGLFNSFLDQTQELTAKQVHLEYGPLLLGQENIEKAFKTDKDKLILTHLRLLAIIRGKGETCEILSIPYSRISRFSICGKGINATRSELNIYLPDQERPLKISIKNSALLQEVYRILSKNVFGISTEAKDVPIIEINRPSLQEQLP